MESSNPTPGRAPAGGEVTISAPSVEVLIPTLNEARHISDAVENASKLGPVFVIDSFSSDGTQDLARRAGATVVERRFDNYAAQKNWALDHLAFQGQWVFILDADERIPASLRDEVLNRVVTTGDVDAFYVNRLLLFMGRAVRHGGLYPAWNMRLFRRGKVRYEERAVHEHMICPGRAGYLHHEMLHIRDESIAEYLEKHIRYANLESEEWLNRRLARTPVVPAGALFTNRLRYRQWLRRAVWPRLPLRPLWRFVFMYGIRLGFLDGAAGWHLAWLMVCYEYMITLLYQEKLAHLRANAGTCRGLEPDPLSPP